MAQQNVLWVLGAGFSKSLGGPLLGEFFSEPQVARLDGLLECLPEELGDGSLRKLATRARGQFQAVAEAFRLVGRSAAPSPAAPFDAEQFLSFVEIAAIGNSAEARAAWNTIYRALASVNQTRVHQFTQKQTPFSRIGLPENPQGIAKIVRQFIAASCSGFMHNRLQNKERFEPYVRWRESLGTDDVVATFNYDRIVESSADGRSAATTTHLHRLLPGERRRDENSTILLKLHGSVDWIRDADPCKVEESPTQLWRHILTNDPWIVGPGPDKADVKETKLASIWIEFAKAIREADVIVLLGYRLAPGDAHARKRFLDALTENTKTLNIHVVLGPRRDEHVERVMQLLRWARRRKGIDEIVLGDRRQSPLGDTRLHFQPMWVEDFLSVFDRGDLTFTG